MAHFNEKLAPLPGAGYRYKQGEKIPDGPVGLINENKLSAEDWEYWFRIPGVIPFVIDGIPTWLYAIQRGNVSVYVLDIWRRCGLADPVDNEQFIKIAKAIHVGYGPFNIENMEFNEERDNPEHFEFARQL
jgi:hypothetical protein